MNHVTSNFALICNVLLIVVLVVLVRSAKKNHQELQKTLALLQERSSGRLTVNYEIAANNRKMTQAQMAAAIKNAYAKERERANKDATEPAKPADIVYGTECRSGNIT